MATGIEKQKHGEMTAKEAVAELVRRLPDDATLDEIREEVETLAAIRRGKEEIARGEFIPHEEARKRVDQWLAK